MKTYQDLLETHESKIPSFCYQAVMDFQNSQEYKDAKIGESYYAKHNITIENFQKYLRTLSGQLREDIFSSNYKLKTLFFRRLVTQQVQYVLGNGISFANPETKEKLGKDFDYKVQLASKRALSSGRAFGFWNIDHVEVFGFADTDSEAGFCPLYSEETAELMGGVRFWFKAVDGKKIFRGTLYEPDGYTEIIKKFDEEAEILKPKRSYKITTVSSQARGVEAVIDSNYDVDGTPQLPIVQLFGSDTHESELVGIRECIDCYDLIKSGLANDIDDTSGFYWILKNTGGMDDPALAQFIQRMKTVRAAVVDGDQDATAEAHTLDIPVNARQYALELLRKDIYEDFQALDVNTLSAAQKTAQEIQAAYQAQDNKCADFQYHIEKFVQGILRLAGITDEPSFRWNRVTNQPEMTQMVLSAGNFLDEDVIIRHLPFLTPEEIEEIIAKKEEESMEQFNNEQNEAIEDPQEVIE